jgi:hypothetical protein
MAVNTWWDKISGEMDKLRTMFGRLNIKVSGFTSSWKLDSSEVDYALARALYDNVKDDYKLGAGFCKKIINSKAGFIGVPKFASPDPEAQGALDLFFDDNISQRGQTKKKRPPTTAPRMPRYTRITRKC